MAPPPSSNGKSTNPSQLGDPVSLKAETSDTQPTENDRPKGSQSTRKDGKSLKQVAEETNPTMLGDPISLKAETSERIPTEGEKGAAGDRQDARGVSRSKL